jgi:hypothetical protein
MSMKREGHFHLHNTNIGIWEEHVDEASFRSVYQAVVAHFRSRGFRTIEDPYIRKHFSCIARYHHVAKKGLLEAHMNMSGRHIEIEFFQSVIVENRNGGRYDFEKFEKMPYLVKKQFILEAGKLLDALVACFGYKWGEKIAYSAGYGASAERVIKVVRGLSPSQEPLQHFNGLWGTDRFKRDETGWPIAKEYDHGYNKDREGVSLRNGMYRYYRDRSGRLRRGVIYTNMNSMWQLIYGPGWKDSTWVSSRELFTLQPGDPRRRHFPECKRREFLERELKSAVQEQRFEQAAILRDLLKIQVAA